jgi:hypothetical protein
MGLYQALFLTYTLVYAIWTITGIYDDFKSRSFLTAVIFSFASIIGLSGLILYFLNIYPPVLKDIWKILFVIFLAGEFHSFMQDIRDFKQDEEIKRLVPLIIIVSILLMIPVVCINFLYAYC